MSKPDLKLKYLILYNPELKPVNPKADEVEFMDSKLLYFYPPLTDINIQRNLLGVVEGIQLFFGKFAAKQASEKDYLYRFQCNDGLFLLMNIENSLYLTVAFSKLSSNERYFQEIPLTVLRNLMRKFVTDFEVFNGGVGGWFTEIETVTKFKEVFLYYIESFFKIAIDKHVNSLDHMGKFVYKRKFPPKEVNHYLQLNLYMRNIEPGFKELIVFKSGFCLFSVASNSLIKYFSNYLFDFADSHKFEKGRTGLSDSFTEDNDFSYKARSNKKGLFIIGQKNSLIKIHSVHLKKCNIGDFYFGVLAFQDVLMVVIHGESSISKEGVELLVKHASNIDILQESIELYTKRNYSCLFFNLFSGSVTNCKDMACLADLQPELKNMLSAFLNKRNRPAEGHHFILYKRNSEEIFISEFCNRAMVLHSPSADKVDLFQEYLLVRQNAEFVFI